MKRSLWDNVPAILLVLVVVAMLALGAACRGDDDKDPIVIKSRWNQTGDKILVETWIKNNASTSQTIHVTSDVWTPDGVWYVLGHKVFSERVKPGEVAYRSKTYATPKERGQWRVKVQAKNQSGDKFLSDMKYELK